MSLKGPAPTAISRNAHAGLTVSFVTTVMNESDTFQILSRDIMQPLSISLGQTFEIERQSRELERIEDIQELQKTAKQLLLAWQKEIARSRAAVRQATS